MARTNDMLNRTEFRNRINDLRAEIRMRSPGGPNRETTRLRGVLREWILQYRQRFGVTPSPR
ncbi:hypothetical protein CMI37_09365 [Candidatus Pacearchaeota archaeon]|nr:hypothetical protein [Candidatus Pacearchaeota archaeon]|tara:strand:- start:2974 stop:3159 length:186 start_codon:yes stop_codon:yes gene_type:complete